jgi:lipopolysaccharide transport system ATP-binding protein
MSPAIRVDGLSKLYRVGARQQGYKTLRESIADAFWSPLRKLGARVRGSGFRVQKEGDNGQRLSGQNFWALKDVSFEVQPGEVVGIIGRNGAGKSTLLKILSRITEPTSGTIELRGRVGSLLEVGTGFHPELTGRENVYMNGSILGMSHREIQRKFDEIVAFAEIEDFLDTPVKRYSSGMYVRLAFAVAAHLEPEILIVDEVLAVGDGSFQKKCLNKMEDVGRHGRTVLFVSHNMPAVTRLCQRAILLNHGKVVEDGRAAHVATRYLTGEQGSTAHRKWTDEKRAPQNDIARLLSVRIVDTEGRTCDTLDIRNAVGLEMTWRALVPGHHLAPNFHVYNDQGVCVFIVNDQDPTWRHTARPAGLYVSTAWIPGNFLSEGGLVVGAAVSTLNPVIVHFEERDAVAFQVIDPGTGDSVRREYAGHYSGVVRPMLKWTNEVVVDDIRL